VPDFPEKAIFFPLGAVFRPKNGSFCELSRVAEPIAAGQISYVNASKSAAKIRV